MCLRANVSPSKIRATGSLLPRGLPLQPHNGHRPSLLPLVGAMRFSRLLVAGAARPPPPIGQATVARAPPLRPMAATVAAATGWAAVPPQRGAAAAAPPMPPTGWLATRPLATVAAPTAAPALANGCAVLLKIGSGGPYSLVNIPEVMGMHHYSLFKALMQDDAFAAELDGVSLGSCTVRVCVSASDKEPSAAEEAAARELRGARTLSKLVGDLVAATAAAAAAAPRCVFVRVEPPDCPRDEPPMSRLARAILAAPEPTPQQPHITLRSGARWPVLGSPVLFVRSFYAPFYDGVLGGARDGVRESRGTSRVRRVCVSGDPGIGKSSFGYYALFRALRAGRTVVYQAERLQLSPGEGGFLFRPGLGVTQDADAICAALNDRNTLFISDCIRPPFVRAFTLLVSVPRRDRTSWFREDLHGVMLYFPALSWDEILDMRAACFPLVTEAEARARFVRWGGIPRYVLSYRGPQYGLLWTAIHSVTPHDLATYSTETAAAATVDTAVSHQAFHIKVRGEVGDDSGGGGGPLPPTSPEYYAFHSREFASNYVATKLLAHWSSAHALRAELRRTAADAVRVQWRLLLAPARGHAHRELALEHLAAGGRFPVRQLRDGGPASPPGGSGGERAFLDLPPARGRHTFDDASALGALPADGQLEPVSRAFCSVDAVLVGRLPAIVTTSASHALVLRGPSARDGPAAPGGRVHAAAGLAAVADALGLLPLDEGSGAAAAAAAAPIPVYWVVPPAEFAAWRQPRPLLAEGRALTAAEAAADAVGRRVEQYVLCVDVTVPPPAEAEAASAPPPLA